MIRHLSFIFIFITASSCSQLPILSYSDMPKILYRSAFGFPDEEITLDTFNSYKYSFAKVRFGKGEPVTLILASIDVDLYSWIGSDGVKLITKNGRIIKTNGLPHDINIKASNLKVTFAEGQFYETVNFKQPLLIGANLSSNIKFLEYKDYLHVGQLIRARVFAEEISIKNIAWQEDNLYIFDENDRALKTIQFIHPFLDEIVMDFYFK